MLQEFRSGQSPLMIATDVASRGLDVKDIKTVINFDFPTHVEDYVHRIGRTGRAGEKGLSVRSDLRDDLADLRLEAHVQHAVGLVLKEETSVDNKEEIQ